MQLRTYQKQALDRTVEDLRENNGCLIVMATGLGKTVTLAHVVNMAKRGKVLVIAHREELIHQLANTLRAVTQQDVGIEMADWRVEDNFFSPKIVVATIQSLMANKQRRLHRLVDNPGEWSLTVVDECHHVPSPTYRQFVEHMRINEKHKVLGVTATPDRLDRDEGGSLACVFDKVSFEYGIDAGINDGWLVPLRQRTVYIEGLDYSNIKTTAGELNQKQLRKVLEVEKTMHMMVTPSLEIIGERQAVFYAANCDQGRHITEIFNRYKGDSARFIDGETPKDERRYLFEKYRRKGFQILVNVGVATEGWDCPEVEVVIMGRPTKSRGLYTQIVGRGLRPLPGLVDSSACEDSPEARRAAINNSTKPYCEVIDFHGNAGRHKLMWTGDILGGTVDAAISQRAREIMEDADGDLVDPEEAIEQARIEAEEREACRKVAAQAKTKYRSRFFNGFDRCDLGPEIQLDGDPGSTLEQCEWMLNRSKGRINLAEKTKAEAQRIINDWKKRERDGMWTFFQEAKLRGRKDGYKGPPLTREEAGKRLDQLQGVNWKWVRK